MKELSAIAVTVGPGIPACLRIGVNKAKALCERYNLPMIPVNHLEGHTLVARILNHDPNTATKIEFPFFLLLVSGGHSQLLVCNNIGDYFFLGGTFDDSLGESFDKVARYIGLPFSQGMSFLDRLDTTDYGDIEARESTPEFGSLIFIE
jgi:tRNA A37 threonylcarbamoyltransferase TsaD